MAQQFDTKKAVPQKPSIKEEDESLTHKAGDVVERIGEKLKDMGAEQLGNAVYKAGNKLEHSETAAKKH